MRRSTFLASALLFLFSCLIQAQQETFPQPDYSNDDLIIEYEEYLEEHRLGSASELDSILDHAFDFFSSRSIITGYSAALITRDGQTWERAAGTSMKTPEYREMSPNHLMGMASNTKSYVAATILLMYEDGLLNLDDSIGMYLDSYQNVPGHATIRHLLGHRSGISDFLNDNPLWFSELYMNIDTIWTIDKLIETFVLEPRFPVDSMFDYSNTNYLLAGRIIEKISGQPWYSEVRKRVLEPFNLDHTYSYPFEVPQNDTLSHAWSGRVDSLGFYEFQAHFPDEGFFSMASSAGNLISSSMDLAMFRHYLHGGMILKDQTLDEMYFSNSPEVQGYSYGLGTSSSANYGIPNWGHTGSWTYRSVSRYFPEQGMSLAVMQNDERVDSRIFDLFDLERTLLSAYFRYERLTSTKDVMDEVDLSITPNPFSDVVTISWPSNRNIELPLDIKVVNQLGQEVYSVSLSSQNQSIDLTSLKNGVYVVIINDVQSQVVIKQD